MTNFWNSIWPVKVSLPKSSISAYTPPPLDQPLPHYMLPPGQAPLLPPPAIPAQNFSVKELINSLPSLFNLNHGNF